MTYSLNNARLEKLMQKKAKIESELARTLAAEKTAQRKLDSRRKIVLGSALLKAISEGRVQPQFGEGLVKNFASERDKSIFEDFTFPTPAAGETSVASASEE